MRGERRAPLEIPAICDMRRFIFRKQIIFRGFRVSSLCIVYDDTYKNKEGEEDNGNEYFC